MAEVYAAHNVFFNRKFQVMVFFEVERTGGRRGQEEGAEIKKTLVCCLLRLLPPIRSKATYVVRMSGCVNECNNRIPILTKFSPYVSQYY